MPAMPKMMSTLRKINLNADLTHSFNYTNTTMNRICTLVLFLICCGFQMKAANAFWTLSPERTVNAAGQRLIIPEQYQLARLDVGAFQLFQSFIPLEGQGGYPAFELPTPDGSALEFRIYEKPMMEAVLANKFPQIKTYTALCVSNPLIMAKLDFTVHGFHAMVMNGSDTYFIDPYANMDNEWYVVYFKRDFRKSLNSRMQCLVDDEPGILIPRQDPVSLTQNSLPALSFKTSGDTIRTYRLALACTEEYSAAVGGTTPTKASVLSAMVTSMNRVNGVFEKEFSMHANLVANNDTLIWLPGSGDPYTNNSGSTMLGQNQTSLTSRIGSANYDYGHVFSTGGGGVANLGCVCSSSNKARGVTGSSNPVGDPFDIDYVAHEMGHQFGGEHTFNSVSGSCSGNRASTSAYEIGSGTTIMAYAGICGTDDIQPHSDDYYHIRSLEQMTGNTVKACAAKTTSGNTPPVLAPIVKTYIIPYRTPFELTASATDANSDPVTYCWEQYNRGGSGGAWNAKTTVAPIFRSFLPSSSGTRVFPTYKELIQNTESYLGELLPDTNRLLRFRCTARDLHSGYGAFYTSTDTLTLDVRKTTTLFRVNSQATVGQSWEGFSSQTITWNVAGTDVAPVAASNVDIYLSIDSGKTWPYPLALNTPNDGSQTIGVPNVASTRARIKVKGSGNVFFDLNDEWIEIKKVVSPAGLDDMDQSMFSIYPNPAKGAITIDLNNQLNTADLAITTLVGATVFHKEIVDGETIQLPSMSKGVYLVTISNGTQRVAVKKLVIE